MIMQVTKVVCGFPGVGKSYLYGKQKELGIFVTDSDSSLFSKIPNENGEMVQNPEFPANYIEYIKKLINDHVIDYIFLSSHHDVREGLANAHIPYTLVYPTKEMKEVYLKKYKDRGSPEKFIELLDKQFYSFVEDCANDVNAASKVIFDYPTDTLYDWVKRDIEETKTKLNSLYGGDKLNKESKETNS